MKKILIVEDDFLSRKLVYEILKNKAECDIAVNGLEALSAIEHAFKSGVLYDLILLDIAMPEMSGIQVLKCLRGEEEKRGVQLGKGTPVIMVTAFEEPFLDAFNNGCDDYIVKPYVPDKLLAKIEEKIGPLVQR